VAQKRRFLDVWIIESNTVYREVPFLVVTDWVQQGRLLGDDRVRPSGTAEWYPIGGSPTFAPYLPKVQEHRAEDQAEALEPVEVEFTWKRHEDEDDDVDMIPLIDISLVLLIFFMMVSTGEAIFSSIDIPTAKARAEAAAEDMKIWVGIDIKGPDGARDKNRPWYSLGLSDRLLVEPDRDPEKVLTKLRQEIGQTSGRVIVRLQADQSLPIETIKTMTVELKKVEYFVNQKTPGKVRVEIVGEVAEGQ
jgi:biopolymer transport protein ExbD